MTSGLPDCECIIEEFVIESGESLDGAVDDVMSLEMGQDQEAVNRIFRVVHTVKGTAAMLGFNALSRFIHDVEDTCADLRSGRRHADKPLIDGLLKCFDFIQLKLDVIRDTFAEDDDFSQGNEYLVQLQDRPADVAPTGKGQSRAWPTSVPDGLAEFLASVQGAKRCKTLIVEDDFLFRKTLYSSLSKCTECHVAKDGCEAIQAVTQSYMGADPEPFSLIVMAARMPVIDGLQTTRAIRAMEQAKGAGYSHERARIVLAADEREWQAMQGFLDDCGADGCMVRQPPFAEPHPTRNLFMNNTPDNDGFLSL